MTFQPDIKYSDGLDYHFFYLNSFLFDKMSENEDDILNDFINMRFFLDGYIFDSKKGENGKVHGPFDILNLKTSDFKKFEPEQLENLIHNLIMHDDWGDDLEDFKKLWLRTKPFIDSIKMTNGTLFHISKDWFSENDLQTWDKDFVYTYFMTFVYISIIEGRIVAFDFGFD